MLQWLAVLDTALNVLLILLVCLLVFIASIGLGGLWQYLTRKNFSADSLDQGIVGFALLSLLTLFFGCFVPLSGFPSYLIFIVAGICGLAVISRWKINLLQSGLAALLFLILVRIVWPLATLTWSGAYDSDLYHFQQIRWLREHGTPLGLGNLHIRLGVSSSFFSLAAALEQGGLKDSAAWFMPVIYPILSLIWASISILRSWNNNALKPLLYYCLVTLPFILTSAFSLSPSLYFDSAAGFVQLVMIGELIRLYTISQDPESGSSVAACLQNICVLAALAISIKFSALVIALLAIVSSILILKRINKLALVIGVFILTTHFIRTALLTGWLLFPAPYGKLPVSWAIPSTPIALQDSLTNHETEMQSVIGHYQIVKAWAKLPGPDHVRVMSEGITAWWPSWSTNFASSFEGKLFAFTLIIFLLSFLNLGFRKMELWLVLGVGVLPIIFWFYSAPDVRFGTSLFWIFLGLTFAFRARWMLRPRSLLVLLAFISVFYFNVSVVPKGVPTLYVLGKAVSADVATKKLPSGLRVRHPLIDRSGDRCGNAKPPCTPYVQENLEAVTDMGRFLRFQLSEHYQAEVKN